MVQVALGLLLFAGVHLWKRLLPAGRARLGQPGKGIVAVGSIAGIWLMARGVGAWEGGEMWAAPGWARPVNNLLMVVAVYLFAASLLRPEAARRLRHPQLLAVALWAVAHLLVNADLATVLLFGGLLLWAVAEMALINRAQPAWTPPPPAGWGREALTAGAAVLAPTGS